MTELSSAFIGTTEATTFRNRISATQYLPSNQVNLDQYSFDSANLSEYVVNVTKYHERGSYRGQRSKSRENHMNTSADRRNQKDTRNKSRDRGSN